MVAIGALHAIWPQYPLVPKAFCLCVPCFLVCARLTTCLRVAGLVRQHWLRGNSDHERETMLAVYTQLLKPFLSLAGLHLKQRRFWELSFRPRFPWSLILSRRFILRLHDGDDKNNADDDVKWHRRHTGDVESGWPSSVKAVYAEQSNQWDGDDSSRHAGTWRRNHRISLSEEAKLFCLP